MKYSILTLRFTRRAIGAAAIRDGEMSLLDGRFLTSRPERSIPAALRYVDKLVGLTSPTVVALEGAETELGTLAGRVRAAVEQALAERGVDTLHLDRHQVVAAFGVTRVVDRRELRELAEILWPELKDIGGRVKDYVADAAAGALVAECEVVLDGRVT
jgi:hypothetical protein